MAICGGYVGQRVLWVVPYEHNLATSLIVAYFDASGVGVREGHAYNTCLQCG